MFFDQRIVGDLRERGERADFDAARAAADTTQCIECLQVDHRIAALDAILQPVVSVLTAGHQPALVSEPRRKTGRVFHRYGLVEIDVGHGVVDCHIASP